MGDLIKQTNSRANSIFLSAFIFIVIASLSASFFIYQTVTQISQDHMYDRAETIAHGLNLADLNKIKGDDSDVKNASYIAIKDKLQEIRSVNSDIKFIYLLGRQNQPKSRNIFFYVDSEPSTSIDYSPPGQTYDEASDNLISMFVQLKGGIDGPQSDRWGTWISALAPLSLPDGRFVLVGIDVSAKDYISNAIIYSSIPLIVGFTILLIFFFIYQLRKSETKFLRSKEAFLAIAAHEIRSPLTGIRWATEQLMADPHSQHPDTQSSLSIIYTSSVDLIARINNLLSYESIEAGHNKLNREEVIIKNLFKEIIESTKLAASARGVQVVLDSEMNEHLFLVVDKEKIRIAFLNLISNAIKYTRPKTEILIAYKKTPSGYHFSIIDEGDGLTPEDIHIITKMFERTKNARSSGTEGSGIGLALTKEIIELHGGKLVITSELGKGSNFTVVLPQSFV